LNYKNQIFDISKQLNIDPDLVEAIVMTESAGLPMKVRYEPTWKYLYKVDEFAKSLTITPDTEKVLQSCSWGLMQIMGSVAREVGFVKDMPVLCEVEVNLFYGCKKLKSFINKYPIQTDAIASYNAGFPKVMANGKYFNQTYVDKVTKHMLTIKGNK
jgi:soluble lytic murein transglycosylase-like protein